MFVWSWRAEAEGGQGPGGVSGVGGGRLLRCWCARPVSRSGGEVAEGGHDLGSVAGPGLECVLAVGDAADVQRLDLQWPRIQAASWAEVAWTAARLVMA